MADVWRKFRDKEYPTRIEEIRVRNLRGAGTAQIMFSGGITAFCGANGVGKSTILRALRDALFGEESTGTGGDDDVSERIEIRLAVSNKPRTRTVAPFVMGSQQGSGTLEVVFFDGGEFSVRLRRLFSELPGVSELLESAEPREARRDELEDASYIVGRQYDAIKTYEVDVGEEDEVPYFVVTSAGCTYSTESMGQGELAALVLLWTLRRLKATSVLLLEEPETYLAPRSQEALLNVLARYSTQKAIWIALTTHSEAILRRIPIEHVRLCYRMGERIGILAPDSQAQYLSQLGIPPRRRGIVLVEDVVARELALGWIGYFSPQLLQEIEVVAARNGESEIRRALMFPRVGSWFKIVGLFDGDQRAFNDATTWPYAFLPGNVSPEVLIRQVISERPADFAVQLARPEHDIALALGAAEGRDAHDWLSEFVRHVGLPIGSLITAFFKVWMSVPDVKEHAAQEFRVFEGLL